MDSIKLVFDEKVIQIGIIPFVICISFVILLCILTTVLVKKEIKRGKL